MPSTVDICNYALQNIGSGFITSLTENSVAAQQCNKRYNSIRQAVLNSTVWNFATKRKSLTLDAGTPAFEFTTQFELPADYIRMGATDKQLEFVVGNPDFNGYLTISNAAAFQSADNYKIEAKEADSTLVLLSNDATKKIMYVYDCTDTTKFPPLFVETLAKGLGAAIAYKITGNRSLAASEAAEFKEMIENLETINSQQGTYKPIRTSSFVAVRL